MRQLRVVGIVGHGYVVPKFFGDLAVTGTPDKYVERVAAAGGRPVVLPGGAAVGLLDVVDALVLTGAGDVDPKRYGGPPEVGIDVDPARDDAEIALVLAAEPGSLTRRVLGGRPQVTSVHHQAVAEPGPCWRATAWADDGVVEAVEWTGPDPWRVLGVQWHPEMEGETGTALFEWLAREAGRRCGRAA